MEHWWLRRYDLEEVARPFTSSIIPDCFVFIFGDLGKISMAFPAWGFHGWHDG